VTRRLLPLLVGLSVSAGALETQTVIPQEDPQVVLRNPDMGWVLYENYPIDGRPNGTGTMCVLPEANFPGCDHVAVMFAWSDIEKEEGKYDWSRVDAAWDYWAQRGKTLQLRMSTEPLFGWAKLSPPGGLGVPAWLLERIPAEEKALRHDGAHSGWHVDARNKTYQDRLRVFLAEANTHFSAKRTPALVDLRGFGRWGEWHSGFPYRSQEAKREGLKAVIEIWSAGFPERMLAMSYSFDPDGPEALHAGSKTKFEEAATASFNDYLSFSAFDLALEKPNITLRRDGAGGAVSSNERKLCEHAYRTLRRAPQMSEFVGGYASTRRGGADYVSWTVDDALSLHPNYISLLGYSGSDGQAFMLERPDLVAKGLRGMGYRLVPTKVSMPKAIRAGEKFAVEMEWINRAAGRALRDFTLKLRLTDPKTGAVLAETAAGVLPTSHWLQGERQTAGVEVEFPAIARAVRAAVEISLFDPASGRTICLPLSTRTRDEFCRIAEVAVEAD